MKADEGPEPWLRATLTEVPPVHRGVLHALELAKEDIARWCGSQRHPGECAPRRHRSGRISRAAYRAQRRQAAYLRRG